MVKCKFYVYCWELNVYGEQVGSGDVWLVIVFYWECFDVNVNYMHKVP